jgi:hypothetical protein
MKQGTSRELSTFETWISLVAPCFMLVGFAKHSAIVCLDIILQAFVAETVNFFLRQKGNEFKISLD